MEDELDDQIIYQTYISHVRLFSKIAGSIPTRHTSYVACFLFRLPQINFSSATWKMLKHYLLKPEVFMFGFLLILFFAYLQVLDLWSRSLLGKFQYSLQKRTKLDRTNLFELTGQEKSSWEKRTGMVAAYAIQGHRPKMEDRFVVDDNINNSGVSLYAVFDGHGGEFAANYAKEKLIHTLNAKIVQIKDLVSGKAKLETSTCQTKDDKENEKSSSVTLEKRPSFKQTSYSTDECVKGSTKEITDNQLISKLNSIKPIRRDSLLTTKTKKLSEVPITSYFNKAGVVDYGKLITDEVLAADQLLMESAKKTYDVAGTTALIAILEGKKLTVANVGDSRGVMCDSKGNAIPLSFDHKPQQVREKKRIKEAGGFVSFNGVWRVAGILATSRALGDYPLKDKNLIIADPDVLTFNLTDHKPQFVILASDGLWDTFSNDEAVQFIKERLHESDFGAKSLVLQSFNRGSLDNITVIVVRFDSNNN